MIVIAMTDEIETVSEAVGEKLSGKLGATHLSLKGTRSDANPATLVADRFRSIAFSARVRSARETTPTAECVAMTKTILEAAVAGNVVIRGNRAVPVLRNVDHVMRVRVYASAPSPAPSRQTCSPPGDVAATARGSVTRAAESAGISEHVVETSAHAAQLYDIVLDANRLSVEQCVDVLCELASSPAFQPTAETRSKLADLLRDPGRSDRGWREAGGQIGSTEATRPIAPSDQQPSLTEQLAHAERVLYGTWPNRRIGRGRAPAALRACWD